MINIQLIFIIWPFSKNIFYFFVYNHWMDKRRRVHKTSFQDLVSFKKLFVYSQQLHLYRCDSPKIFCDYRNTGSELTLGTENQHQAEQSLEKWEQQRLLWKQMARKVQGKKNLRTGQGHRFISNYGGLWEQVSISPSGYRKKKSK